MHHCAPFSFVAQAEGTELGWKINWFEQRQQTEEINHMAAERQPRAEVVCVTNSREGLTRQASKTALNRHKDVSVSVEYDKPLVSLVCSQTGLEIGRSFQSSVGHRYPSGP